MAGVAKLATLLSLVSDLVVVRYWYLRIWLAYVVGVCVVVVIDLDRTRIEHGLLAELRIEEKGRPRLLDSIPSSLPIFGRILV